MPAIKILLLAMIVVVIGALQTGMWFYMRRTRGPLPPIVRNLLIFSGVTTCIIAGVVVITTPM